eukprot:5770671-Pleurochrysis_carterae.AAC.1
MLADTNARMQLRVARACARARARRRKLASPRGRTSAQRVCGTKSWFVPKKARASRRARARARGCSSPLLSAQVEQHAVAVSVDALQRLNTDARARL